MKFVPKELKETADISRGRGDWRSFLLNCLSVAITLVVIYLALGLMADITARYIPERYEAKFLSRAIGGKGTSPDFLRAQAVFDKLLTPPGLRPLPYKLYLLPSSKANAFAVPGGGVGVTAALLEGVRSEAGIAMVLAHELGHHQHRHTLKGFGRAILHRAAFSIIFGDSSKVMEVTLQAAESGYSRAQEEEADEWAIRLVHSVYGNTDGALEFFERIRDARAEDESRWSSFLDSHPYTPDRIDRLREIQKTLKSPR